MVGSVGFRESDRPAHLRDRHVRDGPYAETAVLQRKAAGAWDDDGEWHEGADLPDREIEVTTAPTSAGGSRGGERREVDVDGVRRTGERFFWTAERLVPVSDGTTGDHVVWDGATWLVILSGKWSTTLWESEAIRVDAPE